MQASYIYDAWGNTTIETNVNNLANINPFRYRGYYYDNETNLYYLNSRYYDSNIGRFINADRIQVVDSTGKDINGLNLYAYCFNNAVNMCDSSGQLPKWLEAVVKVVSVVAVFVTAVAAVVATGGAATVIAGIAIGEVTGGVQGYAEGGWDGVLQGMTKGAIEDAGDGFVSGAIMGGISGAMNPSYCFIAGTKVLTEQGHKNIEDVAVGDRVLSFDDNSKTTSYKNVVQLFRNQTKELVHIYTNGEKIVCTKGHPFYVENKGWVKAQDLLITDTLQLDNGAQVSINDLRIETLEQEVTVYNFEVEDNHTYYVSESNVLCHNMCRSGAVKKAWKQERNLVSKTGKGTRNWNSKQKMELLKTGKVKGFQGHHINSVKGSPSLAGNPDNIRFVTKSQHLRLHAGNYRNVTYGKLLLRSIGG